MAEHIPFVSSELDCELVIEHYPDSCHVRVPLRSAGKLLKLLPGLKVWVDAGVDGFDRPSHKSNDKTWKRSVQAFPGYDEMSDPDFHARPNLKVIEGFVFAVLDACLEYRPDIISVPQLPIANDSSRNGINRALANACSKWRATRDYGATLMLPAIFTDQKQLNKDRGKRRKAVISCYERSSADGLWIVDASMQDQLGTKNFATERFPGIINFHKEIIDALPGTGDPLVVAGPYWGLNLVIWARGLCTYPAIGVGGGYQYHVPGLTPFQAVRRLAIPPLCRWARAQAELRQWLTETCKEMSDSDSARESLCHLRDNYAVLTRTKGAWRGQIARFYKEWFEDIASNPRPGRSMALFQTLSAAFATGKKIGTDIASEDGPARKPHVVAEALMMNCL